MPFDEGRGTIPNDRGRVLDEDGEHVPGLYCTGWIKRGPSGVIGTNKKDATETVALLLEDAAAGRLPRRGATAEAVDALLAERGVAPVLYAGWTAIDEVERAAAASRAGRASSSAAGTSCSTRRVGSRPLSRPYPRAGDAAAPPPADGEPVTAVLVECLNCGETRWRKPRLRHSLSVGDCCPRCAYVGWAPTGDARRGGAAQPARAAARHAPPPPRRGLASL